MARAVAGSQGRLRRASHIGPWRRDDYHAFKRLCNEALWLEPPDEPFEGLMGMRRTSAFPDVPAARKALKSSAVYQWLAKHLPSAIETTGDKTSFVQFRRARIVAAHVVFGSGLTSAAPVRLDKRRIPLLNAIERIEQSLNDGTLSLANMAKEEVLENLLAEARETLQRQPRRPKSHAYPWLRRLADALCEEKQIGTADPKLLLEVAAALGLNCDERTARRYAAAAQQAKQKLPDT